MQVYLVIYEGYPETWQDVMGVYATFDDAVNAIIENHTIDHNKVLIPEDGDTEDDLRTYLTNAIIGDLYKWGRTDFVQQNFFIRTFEMGEWIKNGKLPDNVVELPQSDNSDETDETETQPNTEFDMDTYMSKRF